VEGEGGGGSIHVYDIYVYIYMYIGGERTQQVYEYHGLLRQSFAAEETYYKRSETPVHVYMRTI